MATITDVLAASGTTPQAQTSSTSTQSGDLGKDDFLKLLVTQLQNQDPLKPTDNDAFSMESAAFSQVQQLTQLVSLVQQLVNQQTVAPAAPTGGSTGAGTPQA
jgi:flagellar hook assembly protein FlgD